MADLSLEWSGAACGGVASTIAGALNAVAAGPNTSAPVDVDHFTGSVSRDGGRKLTAEGRATIPKLGAGIKVGGSGNLDPPTGRAEISASGLKGRDGLGLPERVRFYTTPSGELDVYLSGPPEVRTLPDPLQGNLRDRNA